MKVAVFFGGRSCEHDISVITAVQAMAHLNEEKYEIIPIYMKGGAFYTGDELRDTASFGNSDIIKKCTKLWLMDGMFYSRLKNILIKKFQPDVALICCHGGEGENGILQGILEYNRIPYTSAGVMSSAVCMDKIISKQLAEGLLYNTIDELSVMRNDYIENSSKILHHIETFLEYPMIVKPANLGSSIGIKRACNREQLAEAIDIATRFDRKIIVERALSDFTELNCAVVSNGKNIIVSEIERPLTWQDILTFEDKYMSGGKGMSGELRQLPAKIPTELYETVQDLAGRIYQDFDMSGVVRIDFLLSATGKLYVNEINTIPGSLSFYLFEPMGITYSELLDYMINGALHKFNDAKKSRLAYNSGVLKNFNGAKTKRLPKYQ